MLLLLYIYSFKLVSVCKLKSFLWITNFIDYYKLKSYESFLASRGPSRFPSPNSYRFLSVDIFLPGLEMFAYDFQLHLTSFL